MWASLRLSSLWLVAGVALWEAVVSAKEGLVEEVDLVAEAVVSAAVAPRGDGEWLFSALLSI
ncbi:protein of unknown function [Candidatus Nitrotoga arctica]|uniref:Uncharacterized protein n=1 Tax=Candidatus Nitrotoga arctica TaxID=453162 RepID=A0ABM8YXP0_9PROT|nr:protein of unknown function [Candidatus Nitrotoga arctica]